MSAALIMESKDGPGWDVGLVPNVSEGMLQTQLRYMSSPMVLGEE